MPAEERTTKIAERCGAHPGRQAVAGCEACGRPLCVACAVPVRGRVVGVECVVSVLGEQVQPEPGRGWSRPELVSGIGLGLVVLASILPWTRFGVGSRILGGWDSVPSWSLLASATGVLASVLWWLVQRGRRRGAEVLTLVGGSVAAAAAFLTLIHPPPFTKPWIGPVVAMMGGAIAAIAAVTTLLAARRPRPVG